MKEQNCMNCGGAFEPPSHGTKLFCGLDCSIQHHVTELDKDSCWAWTGSLKGESAIIWSGKKSVTVSRYLFEKHHRPLARGERVSFLCGNKSCCNPSHLYVKDKAKGYKPRWEERGKGSCKHCGKPFNRAKGNIQHCSPECSFNSKYRKGPEERCWSWEAARCSKGYGSIHYGGKLEGAHRVAYILENGPIPEGMHVLHKCDNPSCVNPGHLFLGTNDDNVQDKVSKGRAISLKGQNSPNSRLKDEDVIKIKKLLAEGQMTKAGIGKLFGVTDVTICHIASGKTWSHIKI